MQRRNNIYDTDNNNMKLKPFKSSQKQFLTKSLLVTTSILAFYSANETVNAETINNTADSETQTQPTENTEAVVDLSTLTEEELEARNQLLHEIEIGIESEYVENINFDTYTNEDLEAFIEEYLYEQDAVETPAENVTETIEATEDVPVEEVTETVEATEDVPAEDVTETVEETVETTEDVPAGDVTETVEATEDVPAEDVTETVEETVETTEDVPAGDVTETVEATEDVSVEDVTEAVEEPTEPVAQMATFSTTATGSQSKATKANDNVKTVDEIQSASEIKTGNTFLDDISESAVRVASKNNLYPSVMMAQAALETGYGNSSLSDAPNYNLFGIKGSYQGESVTYSTREYMNGQWITVYATFRKYPSYDESFEDNAKTLRNGTTWNNNIYSGTWVENTDSYEDATKALTGVYATDPNYNTKLNNIIRQYGLDRFDVLVYGDGSVEIILDPTSTTGSTNSSSGSSNNNSTQRKSYVSGNNEMYNVVSGDTLGAIASDFATTVKELQNQNSIANPNQIYVGQKLIVGTLTVDTTPTQEVETKPVVTAPEKETESSTTNSTYKVVAGDTLSAIAKKYDTTVSKLKSDNNLTSDLIFVGQTLKVNATKSNESNSGSSSNTETNNKGTSTTASTHKVVRGDTLSALAKKYDTTVSKLKSDNNLKSDTIYVGQTLKVNGTSSSKPANSSSNSSSTSNQSNKTETKASTHKVVRGDTLSALAKKYGTTVSKLKSDNNLKSDTIYVGQTLKVNGTTSSNTSNSNTSSSSNQSNKTEAKASTHKVVRGDTLSALAKKYGTTVSKLKSDNNLKSDTIYVGQTLKVNGTTSSNTSSSSSSSTSNKSNKAETKTSTHKVVRGDTLSALAKKYGTTVSKLKSDNNLKSDTIYVGQTLKVSGTSTTSSSKPTTSASKTVKVVSGDTLWEIAKENNTTVAKLKSLNNLSSDIIYVGQTLKVQ